MEVLVYIALALAAVAIAIVMWHRILSAQKEAEAEALRSLREEEDRAHGRVPATEELSGAGQLAPVSWR